MELTKLVISHPVDMNAVVLTQTFGETKYFDYSVYGYPGHNGIDLAPKDGRIGMPVTAAGDGVVVVAKFDKTGYGNVVRVEHGGYSTLYAHLDRLTCKVNDILECGDMLGALGNSGNSSGPHLHFELRIPGQGAPGYGQGQVDPWGYFGAVESGEDDGTDGGEDDGEDVVYGDVDGGDAVYRDAVYGVCTYGGVRVRMTPEIPVGDTLKNVRGSLGAGDRMQLVGRQGDWVGVVMWVHKAYIRVDDDQQTG